MSRAVAMHPAHPDYQAALGWIDSQCGDRTGAVQHLKIAVRLKPADAEYRLRLATVYQATNDDQSALRLLNGIPVPPAIEAVWRFTCGFSLYRIGRFADAIQEFSPLAQAGTFAAPATFFLGNIAYSENRFQDAATYYARAVAEGDTPTNRAYNAYTYNYGLALFRLGKFADAEIQFRASADRYPKDPLPWMYIGRCEQELGNYKSAIDLMEHSIQIDPDFGLAYYELARLQQKYGDPARASQLFRAISQMKKEEIAAEEKRAMHLKVAEMQR